MRGTVSATRKFIVYVTLGIILGEEGLEEDGHATLGRTIRGDESPAEKVAEIHK
jgi:hypothetical protein